MPRRLEWNAALICASHFCYLFSFIRCVKQWWKSLACVTALFTCTFFYTVFFDLFRSLPSVVAVCCLTNVVISVSFVAAGSVWKRGSKVAYAETVSYNGQRREDKLIYSYSRLLFRDSWEFFSCSFVMSLCCRINLPDIPNSGLSTWILHITSLNISCFLPMRELFSESL